MKFRNLLSISALLFLFTSVFAQNLPLYVPYYRDLRPEKPFAMYNTQTGKVEEVNCLSARPERGGMIVFSVVDERGETRFGAMNTNLTVTVPPRFLAISEFSEGLAAASDAEGMYGYINTKGEWVMAPSFPYAGEFHGKYALATNGEAWGMIDRNGKTVLGYTYEEFLWDSGIPHIAFVKTVSGWGLLDLNTLKEIAPCKYWEFDRKFVSGTLKVKVKQSWGFIDSTGKEIVPCLYEDAGHFQEGLAPVKKEGKWGYVNAKGQEKIPFEYFSAGDFGSGMAFVTREKKGKRLWINKNNEVQKEFDADDFDSFSRFSEGLIAFRKKTAKQEFLSGYMDVSGKEVIPARYEYCGDMKDGWAFVSLKDSASGSVRWGAVSANGKMLIEPEHPGFFSLSGWEAVFWYISPEPSASPGRLIDKNGKKYFGE